METQELTPTQKAKIRTLIQHTRSDINAGAYGTYRMFRTESEINEKDITKSKAAIKLLEKLAF